MKRVQVIIALVVMAGIGSLSHPACAQSERAAQSAQPQQQKSAPRNLAILIFDGVQIIDYTGPYEVFGSVNVIGTVNRGFNIYTVSEKGNPITTVFGMSVNPKYSFENAPKPDVLLIPGGGGTRDLENNPNVIKWIQDRAKDAEIVMSVCNGALVLAKAGLLDGLEATTTANFLLVLKQLAPKTRVVDDKRFVDNGKIITTAGLSSGIDGALHVIERLFGRGTAQMSALGMEYNWDPDAKFVRAALADKYMQFNYNVKVLEGGWKPLSREGDRDQWANKWSVTTDSSAAELLDSINSSIANDRPQSPKQGVRPRWTRVDAEPNRNATQSLWKFVDEKGAPWSGTVKLEPIAGASNQFILTVSVANDNTGARSKRG